MRLRTAVLLLVVLSAVESRAATIGLFTSTACDTCGLTIAPSQTATIYARLSDLTGLPPGLPGRGRDVDLVAVEVALR
jgi:hypothetical protein